MKTTTLSKPTLEISVLDNDLNLTSRPAKLVVENGKLLCRDIDAIAYDCDVRGYLWIAPSLVEWADKQGGYWEWNNAETIQFTPANEVTFTE